MADLLGRDLDVTTLSASYQKLGVTSQNELIEKLRARRNGDR
jgi:hypothetical protein